MEKIKEMDYKTKIKYFSHIARFCEGKVYSHIRELFDTKDSNLIRDALLDKEGALLRSIHCYKRPIESVNTFDILLDLLSKVDDDALWKPSRGTTLLYELCRNSWNWQKDDVFKFVKLLNSIPSSMITQTLTLRGQEHCFNLVHLIVRDFSDPVPYLQALSTFEGFNSCLTYKEPFHQNTPLHIALKKNTSVDCIKFLLSSERGLLAIDMANDEGVTPFNMMIDSRDSTLHVMAVKCAGDAHKLHGRETLLKTIEEENKDENVKETYCKQVQERTNA